jgi:hypothetical protein
MNLKMKALSLIKMSMGVDLLYDYVTDCSDDVEVILYCTCGVGPRRCIPFGHGNVTSLVQKLQPAYHRA